MVLKPSHWSKDLKEVTLVTARDGVFNFRMVGGSDRGEFPVISEVLPPDTRGVEYTGPQELTTQVSRQDKTRSIPISTKRTRYFGFLFGERIFEGSLLNWCQNKLFRPKVGTLVHTSWLFHVFTKTLCKCKW